MLLRIISALAIIFSSCQSTPEKTRTSNKGQVKTIPVIAKSPEIQDVPLYIESIGILYPSMLVEIQPQVEGELEEVLVVEGQVVEPGTPLIKINSANYSIQAREAEAKRSSDMAVLLTAQKKIVRFQHLLEKNLIAENEWDIHEMEVEKAKAALEMSQARLDAAKLELNRCSLCSPMAGRVGKIDLHPGMWINKGSASLMSIQKLNPLLVEFSITEKEVLLLPENNGEIELESLSGALNKNARITFLDNHFAPKTGVILLRGVLANPEYDLRPGQSLRVRVPIGSLSRQILIPQKAIRYNDQGPYVYVVLPDQTVDLRQVQMGQEVGKMVVINEGLDSSELVIIEGHLRLMRGAKVDIQEF